MDELERGVALKEVDEGLRIERALQLKMRELRGQWDEPQYFRIDERWAANREATQTREVWEYSADVGDMGEEASKIEAQRCCGPKTWIEFDAVV
ncbi:hypothetical protein PTI98_002152 [Pleurotus ostreatus]|nr:hypothetical protein PTI98_002152 [Pleurotus ostreatus]